MIIISDTDADFIRRFTEIQLETLQIEFRAQCREIKAASDNIINDTLKSLPGEKKAETELKMRRAAALSIEELERHKNDVETAYRHILDVLSNGGS